MGKNSRVIFPIALVVIVVLVVVVIFLGLSGLVAGLIFASTLSKPAEIIEPIEVSSIHGISWILESNNNCETGFFQNGDPWIVVPIGETVVLKNITPGYSEIEWEGSLRSVDGSMLNIECGTGNQGFDSYYASGVPLYDEALNVGKLLQERLKNGTGVELKAGDHLFTSISRRDFSSGGRGFMDQVSLLSIVSEKPDETQFRSGYCNITNDEMKDLKFNSKNLDFSGLRNLNIPSKAPDFDDVLNYFKGGIWLDYVPDWGSRAIHPVNNFPIGGYGREICTMVSNAAMYLHYNISIEKKTELLKYFVQVGIDYYFLVTNGGDKNFVANGGHCACRKFPILLAGVALKSQNILQILEKTGDYMYSNGENPNLYPEDFIRFQEDEQTKYITQYDVDMCQTASWEPDDRADELIAYTQSDIGLPEWIIRSIYSTYPGNRHRTATYRTCCNAYYYHFVISTRLILSYDAVSLWNHMSLFDYHDRHMQLECVGSTSYNCEIFNDFRNLTNPIPIYWESWND